MPFRNPRVTAWCVLWVISPFAALAEQGEVPAERLAAATQMLQEDAPQALTEARVLFEQWCQIEPENPSLREFRHRVAALRSLRGRISACLGPARQTAAQQLVDDLLLPAAKRPATASPVKPVSDTPQQLYARYLPHFIYRLDVRTLTTPQVTFARVYYDAEAKAMLNETMALGEPLAPLTQGEQRVEKYLVLMPLLQNPTHFDVRLLDALPVSCTTPERLHELADFCLLSLGRLDAASAIATRMADTQDPRTARYAYFVDSVAKCTDAHQLGLAARCLDEAIALLDRDDPRVLEHRFRKCDIWANAKNYAMAAGVAGAIAKDLAGTEHGAKARYLRIKHLATQGDFKAVLMDVEDAAKDQYCEPYRAALLYLHWLALRKEGHGERASQVLRTFLQEYPEDDRAAEMYYAVGVDCLSAQRYEDAARILRKLVEEFPKAHVARQAKRLVEKLEAHAFVSKTAP